MNLVKLFKAAIVGCVLALPVQASSIFLAGDSNIFTLSEDNEIFFRNVFNGKTVSTFSSNALAGLGTTATETYYGAFQTIDSAKLAGADFMIFGYNRTSVSASELTAIKNFYDGGGSLFLYGEGATGFNSVNSAVNSILSAVGSTMSLSLNQADNFDIGSGTVVNVTGATPFANNVNRWYTAYASGINLGSGTAVISGTADNGFGVAVALETGSAPSPVPVPGGLPLIASGLIALGALRARRKA